MINENTIIFENTQLYKYFSISLLRYIYKPIKKKNGKLVIIPPYLLLYFLEIISKITTVSPAIINSKK